LSAGDATKSTNAGRYSMAAVVKVREEQRMQDSRGAKTGRR
jgi:hypothetical protein